MNHDQISHLSNCLTTETEKYEKNYIVNSVQYTVSDEKEQMGVNIGLISCLSPTFAFALYVCRGSQKQI